MKDFESCMYDTKDCDNDDICGCLNCGQFVCHFHWNGHKCKASYLENDD